MNQASLLHKHRDPGAKHASLSPTIRSDLSTQPPLKSQFVPGGPAHASLLSALLTGVFEEALTNHCHGSVKLST